MSLYMCLSDTHLSDRPPSSCTDSYLDDLFIMLEEAWQVARERQVVVILIAGDLFHHKTPRLNSHRLMLRLIRLIQDAPCPVYIVPGNHDLQNDRLESLDVTQPLGILFQSGAMRLEGWGSPFKVFGVPWLGYCGDDPEQQEQQKEIVFEALRPFRESQQQFPDQAYLVVAHAPLYPPGQELKYEYFPAEDWYEAMGRNGRVFYGHVHEPHGEWGFYDEQGGVTFCNNGAFSRGSLHEYNLTRQVGVTLWDDKTGAFQFVPLTTAPPADKVFRLQEAEKATDMQGRLDDFLSGISGTTLQVVDVASVNEHVKSMGLTKPETDLIEELLAHAEYERKK